MRIIIIIFLLVHMSKQLENKQSINVTIRIRPFSDKQKNEDPRTCIKVQKQIHSLILSNNLQTRTFFFDNILSVEDTQEDIFHRVAKNSITKYLQGYNCSIFAYGQTGAGKTFTMMGISNQSNAYHENRGLIPRTLQYLFELIQKDAQENNTKNNIKCTFLQIYNQQLIDLLNKSNTNLQIREDFKRGIYVEGTQEESIINGNQALELLKKGSKGRHVGSTQYNEGSSRSHSVFTICLQSKNEKNGLIVTKLRRFHFIDLAGSQKTKLSNGQRLKQGCSINKSLHVLGMVINSLVQTTQGKIRHINYRDSKLTFLLKQALSGNSKTHLIANVNPCLNSYSQTLSTLIFAKRVKQIKLKQALINQDSGGNVEALKAQIFKLKKDLIQLRNKSMTERIETFDSTNFEKNRKKQEFQIVLRTNQIKMNLQKNLNSFMYETIQKQLMIECQLVKSHDKIKGLMNIIVKFQNNEVHLRTIIQIYQQKFKRLKGFQLKVMRMIDEWKFTGTDIQQIIKYINNQKQGYQKVISQMKDIIRQDYQLTKAQTNSNEYKLQYLLIALNRNIHNLKEIKNKVEQNMNERQEMNNIISNYLISEEQFKLPFKKNKQINQFIERQNQLKDQIIILTNQVQFLKQNNEDTQCVLKQTVERQLNLQDELKKKNSELKILKENYHRLQTNYKEYMKIKQIQISQKQKDFQYFENVFNQNIQELKCKMNDKFTKQLKQKESTIQKLRLEIKNLKGQNQLLLTKVLEAQQQKLTKNQHNQSFKQLYEKYKQQKDYLEKELDEINQVHLTIINEFQFKQQQYQREIRDLENNLQINREQIKKLDHCLKQANLSIQNLDEKNRQNIKYIKQLEGNIKQLHKKVQNQHNSTKLLKINLNQSKQKYQEIIRQKDLQLNRVHCELDIIKKTYQDNIAQITFLSQQTRIELTEKMQFMINQHEINIKAISKQLEQQKKHQIEIIRKQNEATIKQIKQNRQISSENLKNQLQNQYNENKKSNQRIQQLQNKVKQLENFINDKDNNLIEVKKQILLLEQEIINMKNVFQQKIQSYLNEIEQKQQQKLQFQQQSKKRINQANQLRLAHRTQRSAFNQKDTQLKKLKQNFEIQRKKIIQYQNEINRLQILEKQHIEEIGNYKQLVSQNYKKSEQEIKQKKNQIQKSKNNNLKVDNQYMQNRQILKQLSVTNLNMQNEKIDVKNNLNSSKKNKQNVIRTRK